MEEDQVDQKIAELVKLCELFIRLARDPTRVCALSLANLAQAELTLSATLACWSSRWPADPLPSLSQLIAVREIVAQEIARRSGEFALN